LTASNISLLPYLGVSASYCLFIGGKFLLKKFKSTWK